MRRKSIILTAVLVLLQLCSGLWALPTTAYEAEMAVAGWLKVNPQPLGTSLSQEVMRVETFTDDYGEPVYYIVYLEPSGFVIVSADDLVEPIIGFADDGTYDPSLENPLGALVTNDLNGRMAAVHNTFSLQAIVGEAPLSDTQRKWSFFISLAETPEDSFVLMGPRRISDVQVAPLVQSEWGQTEDCARDCYNYYTPNNYPAGCGATALAQLIRYYEYPIEPNDDDPSQPDGRREFTIKVDGKDKIVHLRGGDGNGGPYVWEQMPLVLYCSTTLEQRQAIGALCYDAGVAAKTEYLDIGSGTYLPDITNALLKTFKFSNAINTGDSLSNIRKELLDDMVNPNLDAGYPVILGIYKGGADVGHAILADGYGYDSSTPYHHLNMGWGGRYDAWYNLPIVDSGPISIFEDPDPSYNVVNGCIYNIFTSGSGEIISGQVTDIFSGPISGAIVTAIGQLQRDTHEDETDSKGIYALVGLNSGSTYALSVTKPGYNFTPTVIDTGTSLDEETVSGNKWEVDFEADFSFGVPRCSVEGFETGDFNKFPWENISNAPWSIITSEEKHSGTYSAQAGTHSYYKYSTLKLTLDCISGNITFCRKVSSDFDYDYLIFYIDREEKGRWSGEEDWAEMSFPVTAGRRTFEWTFSESRKSARKDSAWIDDIVFPVECSSVPPPPPPPPDEQCAVEDFETGDFSKFPWEHEGDIHWITTLFKEHTGNYSANAYIGYPDNPASTTLRVTLDCRSGNITFYQKLSTGRSSDYLNFFIDGEEKGRWSGEEDWAKMSFPVTADRRTFEWTYTKTTGIGDDGVWIDDIEFPIDCSTLPPPP